MENSSFVVTGSELGRCTVMLTCRTNHAASLSKQFEETYVIPGFQESSADEFIRKYAEETGTDLETFQALRGNSHAMSAEIKELMKTPLYLLYLCILLEDGQGDLPRSRTEVYQNITNIIVNKTSDKLGIEKEACSEAFAELCKLAYGGILDKKMVFEERDLPKEKVRRDIMIAFGFLMEKMSKSRLAPKKLFNFNHKTVQEFLTANHVNEMEEEERNRLLNMKKIEKDWTMVLVFLCGLRMGDDKELDKLYRNVICKNLSDTTAKVTSSCSSDFLHNTYHLGLQCIAESGTFETFLELSPRIVPHSFIANLGTECYYCSQGFQIATKLPLPHKPEVVFHGMDLDSLVFCNDAAENLLTNNEVQSLVAPCLIRVKDLIHLMNLRGFRPICKKLEHLFIYMNPATIPSPDLTQHDVAAVFKALVGLKSLVFKGTGSIFAKNFQTYYSQDTVTNVEQMKKEMQYILQRIPLDVPQLKTLVLCNQVLDTPLTIALSKLSNLTKLHLCTIRTKDSDLADVLRHVGQRKKLTSLVLDYCAQLTSEESRIILTNSIGKIMAENCLRKLTLANIDLRCDDISSFLESFSSMKKVEQLTLGGTIFSDQNQAKIISAIENLRALKVVSMINFGVSKDMTALTNAVRNLETLQVIEIMFDDIGGNDGFVKLGRTLKDKKYLQRVILESCKITDSNIHALKELFQTPILTELSLTGNGLGETEDAVFQVITALAVCSKIREVHLFLDSFSHEIINTMVNSFSNNNKELKTLKVSFKPAMQMFNELDRIITMLKQGIPSLTDVSCGVSMVEYSKKPHKTDHEIWRSECLDL